MFWFDLWLYDTWLLHLLSGKGGKDYIGVWALLTTEQRLLWLRSGWSPALSSWKNSLPNWRRHHIAEDQAMEICSGGQEVHRSARSIAPDVAHSSIKDGTLLQCHLRGGSGARSPPSASEGECRGSQTVPCTMFT